MSIQNRLKIMVFLQFFIWGAWLITLGSYMINTLGFTGSQVGVVYSSKGIAAVLMPSLVGIVADRWIRADRLYGILHFCGAIALFISAQVSSANLMFWVMLLNAMMYMPTIALANTISYTGLEQNGLDTVRDFPPIRIYGTIGFIVAMWVISLAKIELSNLQLYIAAATSLLLSLYSFALPECPTTKVVASRSWLSRLGIDAFVLFKQRQMAVFFLFATLIGALLQITNTFGSPFLHDFALEPQYQDSLIVTYPSLLLSVSQIAEVCFILAIPFFLQRYGIKIVMLISMVAWVLRFGLLAYASPSGLGLLLLIASMIVYGCAFDFFNISGAIFVEKEVTPAIRASAQGLFMTMVNGVGAYIGAILSGLVVDYFTVEGVKQWPQIWLAFSAYAAVLPFLFTYSFRYQHEQRRFVYREKSAGVE